MKGKANKTLFRITGALLLLHHLPNLWSRSCDALSDGVISDIYDYMAIAFFTTMIYCTIQCVRNFYKTFMT